MKVYYCSYSRAAKLFNRHARQMENRMNIQFMADEHCTFPYWTVHNEVINILTPHHAKCYARCSSLDHALVHPCIIKMGDGLKRQDVHSDPLETPTFMNLSSQEGKRWDINKRQGPTWNCPIPPILLLPLTPCFSNTFLFFLPSMPHFLSPLITFSLFLHPTSSLFLSLPSTLSFFLSLSVSHHCPAH